MHGSDCRPSENNDSAKGPRHDCVLIPRVHARTGMLNACMPLERSAHERTNEPQVRHSGVVRAYAGLPLLVVTDWAELTLDRLLRAWVELTTPTGGSTGAGLVVTHSAESVGNVGVGMWGCECGWM